MQVPSKYYVLDEYKTGSHKLFCHETAPSLWKNDLKVSLTSKPSEFEKPPDRENEITLSVGGFVLVHIHNRDFYFSPDILL